MTEFTTVTEGGDTVRSSSETPEQIKDILSEGKAEPEKSDTSEAASVLGKAGAEARKAKDTPETPKEAEPELTEEQELAEAEKLEKEGKLGKPRHDPRAAMLDKARKLAATKRELEQERADKARIAAEVAELRRSRTPEPKEEAKAPATDPRKPKLADFLPQHEKYEDALEAYNDARDAYREQVAAEKAQEQSRGDYILKAVDSFTGRIAKAAEADSGFLERTAELAKALQPSFMRPAGTPIQPRHIISDRIIKSEKNVELMEHFAKNRSELQRIASAGTVEDILYEMAKVESGLGAAPQAPARPVVPSKASPPVSPVAGSPHTVDSIPGPDASYEEHKRFWNAKDKAAARR